MSSYVVSARKYRPKTFDAVIGQSHVTSTLNNAINSGKLAQAFLFCGPRGVGKTTCARILAKAINCESTIPNNKPCDECFSCQNFNKNASFNIHELDGASNNSVEDVRGLIEQVRYAPQHGKYKVYIIDEVHMLSNAAFNAFLKTLEEPPSYAIFILATTEKHKIIPTILSRCQIFDFHRIRNIDIVEYLKKIGVKENIFTEDEALNIISNKCDGSLRDALSIFDLINTFGDGKRVTYKDTINNLHILDFDYYFQILEYLIDNNIEKLIEIVDVVVNKGFDLLNFITGLSEHFRKLLILKQVPKYDFINISITLTNKYMQQSKVLEYQYIVDALNIITKCELNYKFSSNKRLLIELTLINITQEQIGKKKSPQLMKTLL